VLDETASQAIVLKTPVLDLQQRLSDSKRQLDEHMWLKFRHQIRITSSIYDFSVDLILQQT